MSSLIHQPHDKLFRLSMEEAHVARDFIQAHLPPDLVSRFALDTLRVEKETFVDKQYASRSSDVIYSVQLDQSNAYIYLLLEHQTSVQQDMALRLWAYVIRLLEFYQRQHPGTPLPFVWPMVVYSGSRPWKAPRDICALFGAHEALARQWLFQPYSLLEIKTLLDHDIRQRTWCGLMEFALKYRKAHDFTTFLEILLPWLHRIELENHQAGVVFGKILLEYILDGMEAQDVDVFVDKVERYLSSELRGEAMTLAKQFELRGVEKGIQQGRQQGMQEGLEKGLEKGLREGEKAKAIAIAKCMLANNEPLRKILSYTGLTDAEIASLQTRH